MNYTKTIIPSIYKNHNNHQQLVYLQREYISHKMDPLQQQNKHISSSKPEYYVTLFKTMLVKPYDNRPTILFGIIEDCCYENFHFRSRYVKSQTFMD